MPPPRQPKARLTVTAGVYHQEPGGKIVSAGKPWSRWLESDEQPYVRRLTVGEAWQEVDCGWVADVALLVLENESTNPAGVLEVGRLPVGHWGMSAATDVQPDQFLLVPAGYAQSFQPADVRSLRVRCRAGTARCTLTAIPA